MHHDTINELLIVYGKDGLWSTEERSKIINCVAEIYGISQAKSEGVDLAHQQRDTNLMKQA